MIEVGKKYGCLTVLDNGEEYTQTEKYYENLEKHDALKSELQPYIEKRDKLIANNPDLYELFKQNKTYADNSDFETQMCELNNIIYTKKERLKRIEAKLEAHYKCQCKCGKINYYNSKTIENNPKYCIYPVPISTRHTYSAKAQNATYRKQKKYDSIENVILCEKSKCYPSADYCEYYNKYKERQLAKNEEAFNLEVAKLQRVNAENYDVDFIGKQYESLYIEECCNDHYESEPHFSFTQQHRKRWCDITVYKLYKCRCILCGKEQIIRCNQFGIHPPTSYGFTSYNGYWSAARCDCHYISSFQWIVTKLLFDNNVPYQVEYSFPDLFGHYEIHKLRFDFAVFNEDGSIKCLIECQGEQHYMPVEEFGGESQYEEQVINDQLKRDYAKKNNLELIEISYKDKNFDKIETILKDHNIL